MTNASRLAILGLSLLTFSAAGCAGVHDRQVLNPSRDWRISDGRRERVARLKAPFVTLGRKLRSLGEPADRSPALSLESSEDLDSPPSWDETP